MSGLDGVIGLSKWRQKSKAQVILTGSRSLVELTMTQTSMARGEEFIADGNSGVESGAADSRYWGSRAGITRSGIAIVLWPSGCI
jgi:hypothetical protein